MHARNRLVQLSLIGLLTAIVPGLIAGGLLLLLASATPVQRAQAEVVALDSTPANSRPRVANQPVTATTPLTTHPRLWLTQADLPRLRSWAVPANPMYQQGFKVALASAVNTYNTKFFPGGVENPTWPDAGGDGWDLYVTEAYAEIFAFASLIDPDPSARATYAHYGRNLLMHVINKAAQCTATSQPYCSSRLPTYNRANWWGEAFGLTVDWLQYSNALSAQDKATIRTVFMGWAYTNLYASQAPLEPPYPVGVTNDPLLLKDLKHFRLTAGNYFSGHARHNTLLALSLDAADDPPLDSSQPDLKLGNTLRSYIGNATGAWLYQQYAMYEDPAIVGAAYGLTSTTGLGLASGGLSVEGFLYAHSLAYVEEALLALHTAGYDNVALSGPQINLTSSVYWDRFVNGLLHSLEPTSHVDPAEVYHGLIYRLANYGDVYSNWLTPDMFQTFGALGVYDQLTGNATRLNADRWIALNAIEGGAPKVYNRAGNVWGDSNASMSILYFMLFDPNAPTPTDPRPALPTTFFDKPYGRLLSRTDWTTNTTWFDYKCSWASFGHQNGDCGQFELFRRGEWLTKERSGYAGDGISMTPDYHNTLSLQNKVPANLYWFEGEISARGGQWLIGYNAGDPSSQIIDTSRYAYALSVMTPLYNRPDPHAPANDVSDILHASRSLVWLKPDYIIVYDRATSKTANRFKRFNVVLTANATITNHLATVHTPGGQNFYIRNLLPLSATLAITPVENFGIVAALDPTRYRLIIEDPSNPTDVRFLNVLQGADAGVPPSAVTTLHSLSGTVFSGMVVSQTAILFPENIGTPPTYTVSTGAPFTRVTYLVDGSITDHLVTGLRPNMPYSVTTATAGLNVQVTVQPEALPVAGVTLYTDAGGVLVIGTQARPRYPVYLPIIRR